MDDKKVQRIDAINNKTLIINVAKALFLEEGVESVSMQKIAREANVGQGTLYRHFKNKSALCLELIDSDVEDFFLKVNEYIEKSNEESPVLRGKQLITYIIELKENNLEMLTVIENAGEKGKSFLQTPFYQRLQEIFTSLFAEMPSIKDPSFHADLLLNSFSSDIYNYQRFEKGITKEAFCSKLVDSFFIQ